jgi:hypothetical protein
MADRFYIIRKMYNMNHRTGRRSRRAAAGRPKRTRRHRVAARHTRRARIPRRGRRHTRRLRGGVEPQLLDVKLEPTANPTTFQVGLSGKEDNGKGFLAAIGIKADDRVEKELSFFNLSIDLDKKTFSLSLVPEVSTDGFSRLDEINMRVQTFVEEHATHNLADLRAEFAARGMNISAAAFNELGENFAELANSVNEIAKLT